MTQMIYTLEYVYGQLGEDYYHIGYYDESQPLNIRRESVDFEEFRKVRREMTSTHKYRIVYFGTGELITFDINEQLKASEIPFDYGYDNITPEQMEQLETDYDNTIASFETGTGRL